MPLIRYGTIVGARQGLARQDVAGPGRAGHGWARQGEAGDWDQGTPPGPVISKGVICEG